METHNNQYEKVWRAAFYEAEIAPSDKVWSAVDNVLVRQESGNYKKRFFAVSLLAAASLAAALAFGVLVFINSSKWGKTDQGIASEQNLPQAAEEGLFQMQPQAEESVKDNLLQPKNIDEKAPAKPPAAKPIQEAVVLKDLNENKDLANSEDNKIRLLEGIPPKFEIRLRGADPYIVYAAPMEIIGKSKDSQDKLWAGVRMAGGSFDPNFGSGSAGTEALANAAIGELANSVERTEDTGFGYSVGVNFGTRIAKRWLLQSGIQYSVQNSGGSTNLVGNSDFSRGTSLDYYQNGVVSGAQIVSNPLSISNNFEFVSIPVQVGYLIIDKKFGWAISSGISTEFFIKNTLTDDSGQFEDVTFKSGSSSPFNTFFINGLVGTELMYRFNDQYSISFEPRYTQAITSLTSSGTESKPRAFNLGLRFKYMLK